MSTQKTQRQPLSDKHRLIIIITAIVLAAVIAVSVTLGIMLKEPVKTPDPNDPNNNPSSNLPVKNGDFGLISSEDTPYPKSATNWTRYGYKEANGSAHDFEPIESTENVVMGIIDTDDEKWQTVKDDLTLENITLGDNPKQYQLPEGEKHTNSNVYMIATKPDKTFDASIISDSVSVAATTSVKITVRINTSQLKSGTATIMIQNHSSTPNAKEDNWYAYNFQVQKQDGWQELSFHVFNRKTSTQYIRVSVGLGNVYKTDSDQAGAEGILFIDDISYETVTANDYRIYADNATEGDTSYKIIEKEEETTLPQYAEYLTLKDYNTNEAVDVTFNNSDDYVAVADYSPFTTKDDFTKPEDSKVVGNFGIYKLENDGSIKTPVALTLQKNIELSLDEDDYSTQDYKHISFWVRTKAKNNNALAYANVLVQRLGSDNEWTSLDNGDFTVKTSQDIKTDTNNGWTKYDIYLKPAQAKTDIRLVFALGTVKGYDVNKDVAPNGELYVTTPYLETISISAYNSASSSNASKKFDLAGSSAETTVTNGSFSSISANSKEPTGWTPAFAGQNIIYRDGLGDIEVGTGLSTDKAAVAGSGVVNWEDEGIANYVDDAEGRVLKLVSNKTSSFGYVSGDITASAHTVYVFSVLAKIGGGAGSATATPYFYLLQTGAEDRNSAILAHVSNVYSPALEKASEIFCQPEDSFYGEGWTRYYIVYVTGDKDTTVKLALFNGSLDGESPAGEGATIYYDKVAMQTLGTYSLVEDEENKDADKYIDKFSAGTDYEDTELADCKNIAQVKEKMTTVLGSNASTSYRQPTDTEWEEMYKIPEPDDDDDNDDNTTPAEKTEVNIALLFSILSSVLLVAALAVVVVIRIYRQRKRNA